MVIPKVMHQTKWNPTPDNEAIACALYDLSLKQGHIDKDKNIFESINRDYTSYRLQEGLIHPYTIIMSNDQSPYATIVPTKNLVNN